MIKIIIAIIISVFANFVLIYADFGAENIIPTEAKSIATVEVNEGTGLFDTILSFVRDSIFGILGLVAVGMFLYVGFSLVKAQGNPEDLKKAFMTLIHVIVGLFIVALSWAFIQMISGITF